jgi:hypothetical protein
LAIGIVCDCLNGDDYVLIFEFVWELDGENAVQLDLRVKGNGLHGWFYKRLSGLLALSLMPERMAYWCDAIATKVRSLC